VKTLTWTEGMSWENVMRQAEQEDVVVLRDGHPIALVTPFDDDDLHLHAPERDPAFLASIAQARQQIARGNSINHGDLKRALEID
jgi:hypothetical protein